jgi:uncharacterized protein
MQLRINEVISRELQITPDQVNSTVNLLNNGGTVPFIARYRKEQTGGLDEVQVIAIRDRVKALGELKARLETILKSLQERNLLTDDLEMRLRAAESLTKLEDIYLPFRPKKQTRAMVAKDKGFETLALEIMEQSPKLEPLLAAQQAIDLGAQAQTPLEALALARDIIAELISEDETARFRLRTLFFNEAMVVSRIKTGMEEKAQKYQDYFDYTEKISNIPSHRYLAVRRAEASDFLIVQVQPELDKALAVLRSIFIKNDSPSAAEVDRALIDSYKRLLSLSMETEVRLSAKKKADLEAIGYFSKNLRDLLMAPPLRQMPILAIDPGFKTGCKMVALSADGDLLDHATIYAHTSKSAQDKAASEVLHFLKKYDLKVVAVGNGTAGRETCHFVKNIPSLPKDILVVMASESGASIYSASPVAREEFPDLDVTVRGAISIGRRLIDPLAELVKIDPKSIGVGQYQYDVDQNLLKGSLDDVVVSCVNNVGVFVNTASEKLLSYVSGLGPSLAKNIIKYRQENGPFKNRFELLKVPRLGPKAFELSAGFLRVAAGDNPLDQSAVHPESYQVVENMATSLGVPVLKLITEPSLRNKIKATDFVNENVGLPTVIDILAELEKPGRDPRESFNPDDFSEEISTIQDLNVGQKLNGVVTNLTAFGAFVDVGVHVNGLVHISEISSNYVKNVSDYLKIGQKVVVWVRKIDVEKNRIEMTMVNPNDRQPG